MGLGSWHSFIALMIFTSVVLVVAAECWRSWRVYQARLRHMRRVARIAEHSTIDTPKRRAG